MKKDFEQLPHTADIKIRVYGETLASLFVNALYGMFQSIHPIAPGCIIVGDRVVCDKLPRYHEIEVAAHDSESLLVDFLSEALYLSDVNNEAYFDAVVHSISDQYVSATILGVKIDGFRVVELKAVTYHELVIVQTQQGWQADIVFDI